MTHRFEGRNLDEALDTAATDLGVARYQLSHKVLLEKRGFLGGMKRVVIEVEINPENAQPAAPTAPAAPHHVDAYQEPLAAPAPPRREHAARGGRGGRSGGGGRGGRRRERDDVGNRGDNRGRGRDGRGRGPRIPVPPQEEQSPYALAVTEWLEELCDIGDFDVEPRTVETTDSVTVTLYGGDARLFTARNGELLDSFQTIGNKTFGVRDDFKPLELDALDFKSQRMESLGDEARRLADVVRKEGREQLLPAMNPFERRIVHVTLGDDADVTTESRGDGFLKRVAIMPRGRDGEASSGQ